jgi:hypothetical protein
LLGVVVPIITWSHTRDGRKQNKSDKMKERGEEEENGRRGARRKHA